MSIILTIQPNETNSADQLRDRLGDAQLPFQETADGFTVECSDEGTADFWRERFQQWDLEPQTSGEADQPRVEPTPEPAEENLDDGGVNEVLPGDAEAEPTEEHAEPATDGTQPATAEAQPGEADTDVQPS